METKKVKIIPLEVSELKSGTSSKSGKTFNWTLYKVVCKVLPKEQKIEMTGFDELQAGTETEVEIWEDEYQGKKQWKYRTPRRNVWQEINELRKEVDELKKWREEVSFKSDEPDDLDETDGSGDISIDDLGDDEPEDFEI